MNLFDMLKNKHLEDQKRKEELIQLDKEIKPEAVEMTPDRRQQILLDARKGLSEEDRIKMMTDEANKAQEKLNQVRDQRVEGRMANGDDPLLEKLYKKLRK